MFMLDGLLRSFVRRGTLNVIDHEGRRHVFAGGPGPELAVRIHDRRFYTRFVVDPDLAAGEGYMDGTLTLEEGTTLRGLLGFYFLNQEGMAEYRLRRFFEWTSFLVRRWQQSNRKGEAQKNVSHHYDIGNELYRLFLDRNLIYSCAYFRSPDETLEEAQRNKLRLAAAKLHLKPGNRVLDIGSGWGDMAIYLAQMEDVEVTGVTLSKEQHELSNERARAAGVGNRVRFELKDYRDLDGTFDRIVSIGMFEHVGAHHFDEFFAKVNALMPDDGVMMLHSIGSMAPPTTASSFYRKYIFPGGYIPSLSEVFASLERSRLWALDVEILRLHYAETLKHWFERFSANRAKVVEMYDERFARMWEFYLNSAEMMFRGGTQQVFQLQLSRSRDATPLSRDYIIDKQREYLKAEEKKLTRRAA
ncbi:MAG: cyclopropane-fatty-acyl-phospholipid synthase [Alphaproteobacteria bacterium]|nr:MAG: cyclopropane-fatty-acyl-phospholipid synthase [Alphaproteobacteria bacterium]